MLILAVLVMGFTAMASQIVLMRELLLVFYGNEFSIGFIFAGWLLGGGLGSFFSGKIADRLKNPAAAFSSCQILLALLFPLCLTLTRLAKTLLSMAPGEVMPLFPMLVSSFIITFPIVAILGLLFTLGCRLIAARGGLGYRGIGVVFVLEALGSIFGGIAASFLCMRFMGSFEIMGVLGLANLLSALGLQFITADNARSRHALRFVAIAIMLPSILMLATDGWNKFGIWLTARQWKGYELLASKNSVYGTVELLKRGNQISFFDNGLHIYTIPDKMASEESVHYALLEHPHPESVLLIGGGAGGLVEETLKHPVQKVDYVELDPLIIKMALQYLPPQIYLPMKDPRVSIKNVDGRFFVKNTDKKYDCVIVNLGDPYTAQLDRFYTLEFFREVKKILREGGVFSFVLTSSESYINKELGDYLRSIYYTMAEVFSDVKMMPGDRVVFLGSSSAGKDALTYDGKTLEDRSVSRKLDLQFVRGYYLFSKLSRPRIEYMENRIRTGPKIKLNTDFRPSSYYYATIFWASHFRDSLFKNIMANMREVNIWIGLAVACILMIVYAAVARSISGGVFDKLAGLAVVSAGFTGMTFQVIVLIAFQMIYGYVFYKLGIILTAFMAGLSLGGWWITKISPVMQNERKVFASIQLCLTLYPAVVPFIFLWLASGQGYPVHWMGANMIFPVIPVFAGFVGGAQFPLASRIISDKAQGVSVTAGYTYGLDLFGASCGAILSAAFLIPLAGIINTCFAVSLLNASVLFALIINNYKAGTK